MTYHGQVKNGVVIFDELPPPEGAPVRVEVIDREPSTIWKKMRRFSGAVKGAPVDLARNHDHYIHGGPKR